MQRKEKKVRCTNMQKKLLVDYMCSHPEFARGPNAPTPSHEAKWVALKQYLSDYGPDKTVLAWKTTWRDLKRANAPASSSGGDTPRVSVIDQNEMHRKVLSLMRDASSPGPSSSECSVSNDIQDLPKFITEQASENSQDTQADLLFVEKESDPKPVIDASGQRPRVEILETYCVKSWRDLKKRARDEVGRALYARGVTGTDPDPPKLSEMSEKILASIAKDAIVGIGAEGDTTIGGTVLDEEPWVAEQALDESSSSASMETDPPGPGSTPRRRRTSVPSREGSMPQYLLLEDVENLPTFTTHRTSETARADPLSVERINDSKTELETFEAPRKRPRANKSVFSYVKKPVTHPTKIIRIEIHDADSFPNAEQSMCNCHAEVCVQYAVKGSRFEDDEVYSNTMEIISKIQHDLESRS